jgi:hypothetical protein
MKLKLPAVFAATLLITACSSSNSEPSDADFCTAIDNWNASYTTMGEGMTELGDVLSAVEDPEDLPSPEVLHGLSSDILAAADEADGYLVTIIANSRDSEVSADIREMHDLVIEYARWIGNAGLDAEDALEFSTDIFLEIDKVNEFSTSVSALDGSRVEEYVDSTCYDDAPSS